MREQGRAVAACRLEHHGPTSDEVGMPKIKRTLRINLEPRQRGR